MQTYVYHFYGKLQKVSFRRTLKELCDKYTIYGYVKNKQDGSVVALFQQKKDILDGFLPLIRTFLELENQSISIKKIVKKKIKTEKNYNNFTIFYPSILNKELSRAHSFLRKFTKKSEELKILPKHVVLIPDGNRRWLRKNKIPIKTFYNHFIKKGEEIFSYLNKNKRDINEDYYFTLWGFSTENWNREPRDIKLVFEGLNVFLDHFMNKQDLDFKFKHLGRKDRLPKDLLDRLHKLEEKTKHSQSKLNFILALDYGGRDEIIRAIRKIDLREAAVFNEETFSKYLDTKDLPDPDLIIRTSGEKRLSGLFPFQSAYSELYFTNKYFPEFEIKDFENALKEFQRRKRNFGK